VNNREIVEKVVENYGWVGQNELWVGQNELPPNRGEVGQNELHRIKKIKKRIVILATQKLKRGFCLPKIKLDTEWAYGIIKMPTKNKRR